MQCKICNGRMEDTHGTSYGTGEPIYRCKECGWTWVESPFNTVLKDGHVAKSGKAPGS